ncbi:GerMN domain-containing protein [Robertmurraya siralis]|uniref:GerMN domain-containing protein n=1 Tax=Robertmurraya siralis TaxID=77777 RepID=UPI000BA603FE|nr:GerMN domain-containing protein [Robertmurraya siralis]PAE22028.1 hypothetical protein CHH80_02630 [Bacillus sp. 7504-2]
MRKSEWSDEQLEKLLREMPKIEDNRDPRDIYQNISLRLSKKKQRSWIIPSVATAAVVLIIAVLSPNLLGENSSSEQSAESGNATEQAERSEMNIIKDEGAGIAYENAVEENQDTPTSDDAAEERVTSSTIDLNQEYTAVYAEDVDGAEENALTFAIPDEQNQIIVPITVLIQKEKGKSLFEQYTETMAKLHEKEWGLAETFPLKNVELSVINDNILKVNVPSGQTYQGSANEIAFTSVIKKTAKSLGLKGIELYTDNQPGIELGNEGELSGLDLSDDGNYAYYFYYSNVNPEVPYLVPYGESFTNIESALNAMKENVDTHQLSASIPQDIDIEEIHGEKGMLTLQLNEESDMTSTRTILQTIEAILLTAKEFNYNKVKIEYSKLDKIGKFVFNEEMNVPIAPNKRELLN